MKAKRLLSTLALSLLAVSAVGVGLSVKEHKSEEAVSAVTMSRYSVIVSSGSYWTESNARTYLQAGGTSYEVELTTDSDIGSTVTLWGVEYTLYTGLIDLDSIGASTWGDMPFVRKDSTGSSTWNTIYGGWRAGVASGKRNVMNINASTACNEWEDLYWKLVTYSGVSSYNNLSAATKTANLVQSGSSVSDPSTAPSGMSFAGWCTDADLQNPWSGTVTSDLTLYAKYASNTFTITKDVYYDHVWQSSSSESVAEGDSYTPSTPSDVNGYIFKGWYWYSDSDFTYPVGTISDVGDNYTICAVYESRAKYSQDKYFYYVADVEDSAGDTPNYIYSYGGHNEFGSWPGTAITSVATDVHGSFGFQGFADEGYTRHIYKIPYTSAFADDHIIIVYNGGTSSGGDQTANLTLVNGAAYWWENDGDTGNSNAGAAIDFLVDAEAKRNAVVASTGILQYSVCGISASDAATLYNRYLALADKTIYVDSTYTYTYLGKYDGVHVPDQGAVCYYDIMQQLRKKAVSGGQKVNDGSIIVSPIGMDFDGTIIAITVSVLAITGLAIGGYFFLRKKKEN